MLLHCLRWGYKEHAHAWCRFENNQTRWSVLFYDDMPTAAQIQQSDVVVMINPNNPTGQSYDRDVLLKLRAELTRHHGTDYR
ncbi:hypothetical protein P4S72_00800 [Vibrio sp. PP-XX7]